MTEPLLAQVNLAMVPKGAKAADKAAAAKAAAADARKVTRRGARREALAGLNTLAEEVGAARAHVDVKTASAEQVEHFIRVLEPRCPGPPLSTRLRALVGLHETAVSWIRLRLARSQGAKGDTARTIRAPCQASAMQERS